MQKTLRQHMVTFLGKLKGRLTTAAPDANLDPELMPAIVRRHPRLFVMVVMFLILGSYGLLINPFWHVTPDSATYLTLARNVVQGNGYTFNDVPHNKYPPVASFLFAGAAGISNSFLWLNVFSFVLAICSLITLYFVFRLFMCPLPSGFFVLLSAQIFWIFEFGNALIAECPFFLFSTLSVLFLLRYQKEEGNRATIYFCLMLMMLGLAFWTKVLAFAWILPFALALLFGDKTNRSWIKKIAAALLVVVVLLGCLICYNSWTSYHRFRGTSNTSKEVHKISASPQQYGYRDGIYSRGLFSRLPERIMQYPRWLTLILIAPLQVAATFLFGYPAGLLLGIFFVFLLLVGSVALWRKGQVLVSTTPLFLFPVAVRMGYKCTLGRYGIAIAPFLLVVALVGLHRIGLYLHSKIERIPEKSLAIFGILVFLGCNLPLLIGNIYVARSPNFYSIYRHGAWGDLLGVVRYLKNHETGPVVAAQADKTLPIVVCFTGLRVQSVYYRVSMDSASSRKGLCNFVRENKIKYLVTYDRNEHWPMNPLPVRLKKRSEPRDYWQLWRYDPDANEFQRLQTTPTSRWPKKLPLSP
ncbi:MAG: glycosyltransferase family 39 protein [Planctomycetes bacterium]|nr:glycosyltransferase family 39 protein [Planctomycetota bacterium]